MGGGGCRLTTSVKLSLDEDEGKISLHVATSELTPRGDSIRLRSSRKSLNWSRIYYLHTKTYR